MARQKKKTSKIWLITPILILTAIFVIAGSLFIASGHEIPVLNPKGSVGVKELGLMQFTLLLSVVVVVPVFTMLGVFAWKYREGNTKVQYTPEVDGNRWLETLWWGIPIVIIGILSVVTWVTTHELDPNKALASNVPALRVQVVALQWKWLFIYPDQQIATVNELKIPAGTPINFELTADSPMTGFWIPALGTQIYAMSGMSTKLSLIADHAGTYRGTNSNINGKGYSDMNFKVTAVDTRRDFDAWVNALVENETHRHLDWNEYKTLAKPSIGHTSYYHLHEKSLYTEVMEQYMPSVHSSSGKTTESHSNEHGEGRHN